MMGPISTIKTGDGRQDVSFDELVSVFKGIALYRAFDGQLVPQRLEVTRVQWWGQRDVCKNELDGLVQETN